MGMGYPRGIIKANKKMSKTQLYFVLILGVLSYVGIQYMFYRMTFISDEMIMNFTGNGSHISEFINMESGKQMTFWNFFVYKVDSSTISFTRRSVNALVGGVSFSFLNWVFKVIEFLGFLLLYAASYLAAFGRKEYCDDCKKYMTEKHLSTFTTNIEEKLHALVHSSREKHYEVTKKVIEQNSAEGFESKSPIIVKTILHYCEDCKKGILRFDRYKLDSKGKYRFDKTFGKEPLGSELVTQLA
jgi:hypothetical protein